MLTATIPSTSLIHFDYATSCKLLLPSSDSICLALVGCGGNGSWLAPSMARIARLLIEKFHKEIDLHFIDPDRVEAKNVYRQNFCQAEIGRSKADTLAYRYGLAWGVEIDAWEKPLKDVGYFSSGTTLFVGCVDRASARREIHERVSGRPATWWLDCGNEKSSGQVCLGSGARKPDDPFQLPGFCSWLPLPSAQYPELLEEEQLSVSGEGRSCAEMALQDSKGLAINQRMAAEATDYLARLLVTRDLQKMATSIDLASGAARSVYITKEAVLK